MSELRRTKSGLSRDPAQRAVQLYIVAFMGCAVVALLALSVPLLKDAADSSTGDSPRSTVGHVELRAWFGVAAAVISLALPWVTWRHRSSITRVRSVRGTFLTAAVVTMVVPLPGMLFWYRTGLVASAVGVVALVVALAIPRVPAAERTAPEDWRGVNTGRSDDPEHWITRSSWVDHPIRSTFLVLIVVFLAVAVFAGVAMAFM